MTARHHNSRLLSMIEDVESIALIAQAGGGGAGAAPLSRLAFVDQGTTQTARTGSIAFPFSTVSQFLANIGVGATALDSTVTRGAFLVAPPTGSYLEALVIPAFRNVELIGQGFGGPATAVPIVGNVTWANSVAGGGLFPPIPLAQFAIHNINLTGNITVTDDGTVGSVLALSGDELLGAQVAVIGNIVATGATNLQQILLSGINFTGNITSTSNATGAQVSLLNSQITGTGVITAKTLIAQNTTFSAMTLTVPSTAAPSFKNTTFGVGTAPSITGAAGTVATFDGDSWQSFLEAGGTVTNVVVLVAGGSQAALVQNTTSLGNADVSVSLNGTGASAGLTTGGNFYRETTALTGPHIVTVKTGGGELTGDTLDIVKTDTAAQTYTVKNNAGTTLAICPVGSKCWFRVQFNTVVAGDWGLVGGGAGFT